jgi:hypothetical protein
MRIVRSGSVSRFGVKRLDDLDIQAADGLPTEPPIHDLPSRLDRGSSGRYDVRHRLRDPFPGKKPMCRNIRPLFNFDPPATDEEIRAAALQFVRKVSGFARPSKANEAAFAQAIEEVAAAARGLINKLESSRPPRNRDEESAKARTRAARRFA